MLQPHTELSSSLCLVLSTTGLSTNCISQHLSLLQSLRVIFPYKSAFKRNTTTYPTANSSKKLLGCVGYKMHQFIAFFYGYSLHSRPMVLDSPCYMKAGLKDILS